MHVKTERRWKQLLAEAEEAISAGELHLKQLRDIVEERLRFGRDLEHTMTLLAALEKSQERFLKERDRLRDERAANATAPDQAANERQDPNCQVISRDAAHDHETRIV
jgi:septal ring factor EnvC (AmiA/AmiB activator)